MKTLKLLLFVSILPLAVTAKAVDSVYVTFGPVFSYTFGDNGSDFSLGIEPAIWYLGNGNGALGLDAGIQYHFSDKSYSFYSEAQMSNAIIGLSGGPIFNTKKGIGAQGTIWANLFVGGYGRFRVFSKESDSGFGWYIKGIGPVSELSD